MNSRSGHRLARLGVEITSRPRARTRKKATVKGRPLGAPDVLDHLEEGDAVEAPRGKVQLVDEPRAKVHGWMRVGAARKLDGFRVWVDAEHLGRSRLHGARRHQPGATPGVEHPLAGRRARRRPTPRSRAASRSAVAPALVVGPLLVVAGDRDAVGGRRAPASRSGPRTLSRARFASARRPPPALVAQRGAAHRRPRSKARGR